MLEFRMPSPAPPRIWTCFAPAAAVAGLTLASDFRTSRYRVEAVRAVTGSDALDFEPGHELVRVESERALVDAASGLAGVTGHVLYTGAAARAELAQRSAQETGPVAVLIPIRKSPAWWALAQDERLAVFQGSAKAPGHHVVGSAYASRIFRRLYHARQLPGSNWDFLTYFEFPLHERATFEALLAELRDPMTNPEWSYVEAEIEVWMVKL